MSATITIPLPSGSVEVSARWLRSACQCSSCGQSETGLRWTSFTDIPLRPEVTDVTVRGDKLTITWKDGHVTAIDARLITGSDRVRPEPDFGHIRSVPSAVYDEVMDDDSAALTMLDHLAMAGVVRVVAAPTDVGSTALFAERFGPIRETSYGRVQSFSVKPDAQTAANTGRSQHPHTDEPYRYCPPGFIFFHSIVSAPFGQGTSTLVDGFAAAEQLRGADLAAFDLLATTPVLHHRMHTDEVEFSTRSRILSVSDNGSVEAVRFNIRALAPLDQNNKHDNRLLDAVTRFCAIVEDPANQIKVHLKSGEMLMFDNHRIMHGRTSFGDSAPRHLQSCNVDRDAVHSVHRVLASAHDRQVPYLTVGATA